MKARGSVARDAAHWYGHPQKSLPELVLPQQKKKKKKKGLSAKDRTGNHSTRRMWKKGANWRKKTGRCVKPLHYLREGER